MALEWRSKAGLYNIRRDDRPTSIHPLQSNPTPRKLVSAAILVRDGTLSDGASELEY